MPHALPLPGRKEWHRHGIADVVELDAGRQSRVFTALIRGERAVVKLTDAVLADREVLAARMLTAEHLARAVHCVVSPIRIEGDLVREIGNWLMTATPFVQGVHPEITKPADARLMGSTLAELHQALATFPTLDIPPVRALADAGASPGGWQLVHGDFSDRNVLRTSTEVRVFDFDDCGYGPVEYDLANSLYMVMFDADVRNHPSDYEAFRPHFINGYAAVAEHTIDIDAIDEMIGPRIRALARWLADPQSAPIGIRTSSADWLETLRVFVKSHQRREPSHGDRTSTTGMG